MMLFLRESDFSGKMGEPSHWTIFIDLRGALNIIEINSRFLRGIGIDPGDVDGLDSLDMLEDRFSDYLYKTWGVPQKICVVGIKSLAASKPELALDLVSLLHKAQADAAFDRVELDGDTAIKKGASNISIFGILN